MVIDRERIVNKIAQAGEPPAYSFTPPGTSGGCQSPKMFGRDVQKARQILAEAGYPDGKAFPTVTYLYDNKKLNEDIAVEIRGIFLSEGLGVHVELQKQEWKVYLNWFVVWVPIREVKLGGRLRRPEHLYRIPLSAAGGNNRTGWSSKKYDDLVGAAAMEPDDTKRLQIFRRPKILLNRGTPICPLYFYVGIQIYDGRELWRHRAKPARRHPFPGNRGKQQERLWSTRVMLLLANSDDEVK